MRVFTILAMRRTGCHVIAQWIGSLFDGPCQYCNMGDRVTEWIENGKMKPFEGERKLLPAGTPMICGRENQRPVLDSVGILSSEPVLHIRDPFNTLASMYRLSGVLPRPEHDGNEEAYQKALLHFNQRNKAPKIKENKLFVRLWMEYALEYTGKYRFITDDLITTNYNEWLISEEYRRELADRLGLPFSDRGFEGVPRHGGGSSFDGQREVTTEESRQDKLHRFEKYADRDDFWEVLNVPFLWELSELIYPEVTQAAAEARTNHQNEGS